MSTTAYIVFDVDCIRFGFHLYGIYTDVEEAIRVRAIYDCFLDTVTLDEFLGERE